MNSRFEIRAAAAAAAALVLAGMPQGAGVAAAQGLGLMQRGGEGPIQINATQGIEWHREALRYIANGDARARRGEVEIRADRLIAHYRQTKEGGTEIWRMEAVGGVVIASPTETAQGDRGDYDVDTGIMVLTGRNLKLTTQTDVLTARDAIEYHERPRIAFARGNALGVRGDQRIAADLLKSYMVPTRGENSALRAKRFEATGNVCLDNPSNVARGAWGDYDLDTALAHLEGSVEIQSAQGRLQGDRGEINMNTGISRLLPARTPGSGGAPAGQPSRVHGIMLPGAGDGSAATQAPQAAAQAQVKLRPCR